jgi:phenylacetate-coenzyme A ligase PaaK-like adenylate-forming protein
MFREIVLSYPYLRTRHLLRKTEFWPLEKLKGLQEKYLLKVLKYAADRVPF